MVSGLLACSRSCKPGIRTTMTGIVSPDLWDDVCIACVAVTCASRADARTVLVAGSITHTELSSTSTARLGGALCARRLTASLKGVEKAANDPESVFEKNQLGQATNRQRV